MSKKNTSHRTNGSDNTALESVPAPAANQSAKIHGPALRHKLVEMQHDPEAIRELFISGKCPYQTKIPAAEYERKKKRCRSNC